MIELLNELLAKYKERADDAVYYTGIRSAQPLHEICNDFRRAIAAVHVWTHCDQELPPIGLSVLVTDGEEMQIDHMIFMYFHDGRVLLPSDPRRPTTEPIKRWSKYTNPRYWVRLPDMP